MKASVYLAATGFALALASPVVERDVVVTKTETDVEVVTVTALPEAPSATYLPNSIMTSSTPLSSTTLTTTQSASTTITLKSSSTTEVKPVQTNNADKVDGPASSVTQPIKAAAPTDFASTAVYHHNVHRENNSAPALEWDSTYAGYAAETAKKCKFAHDMYVAPSPTRLLAPPRALSDKI